MLIFDVAQFTVIFLTSLVSLEVNQFHKTISNWKEMFRIMMWKRCRATNPERSGLRVVIQSTTSTCIWRSQDFHGFLCVYDDILNYLNIRSGLCPATDEFFSQSIALYCANQ